MVIIPKLINYSFHNISMSDKITIDFEKDLNIDEIRQEFNLFLFNSPLFSTDQLKLSNKIFERLKNVKLEININ